jgi:hypothetical protein
MNFSSTVTAEGFAHVHNPGFGDFGAPVYAHAHNRKNMYFNHVFTLFLGFFGNISVQKI